MFCGKCGSQNDEAMKFCGTCGTPINGSQGNGNLGDDNFEEGAAGSRIVDIAGAIIVDATREDQASVTIGSKALDAGLVYKIISAIMAFAFLLPLFTIRLRTGSIFGINVSTRIGGYRAIFGGGGESGSFFGFLLILMPVLLVVLHQFKKPIFESIPALKGKLFMISAGISGASLLLLFILRSRFTNPAVVVRPNIGFFLSLLIYLLAIALSALFICAERGIKLPFPSGKPSPKGYNDYRTAQSAGMQQSQGANTQSASQGATQKPFDPSQPPPQLGLAPGYTPTTGMPTVNLEPHGYIGQERSGIMVLLLSIVTCGIYTYYFYYTVMEDINKAAGEQRINSTGLLLGAIFCAPIFIWVILYNIDKGLVRLSHEHGGYYKESFGMWILLSFLAGIGGIVASFNICDALNDIWRKRRFG